MKLQTHHKEWAKLFELEKKYLMRKFKDFPINIEHIGATAICGVPAKPIVDMMVGVPTSKSIKYVYDILTKLGYEDRGGGGVLGQRLFVKGSEEKRTHYIHVTRNNSLYWNEHIAFRDYLRENKRDCEAYSDLKKKLAEKFSDDRTKYTKGKGRFVGNIIKKAKK